MDKATVDTLRVMARDVLDNRINGYILASTALDLADAWEELDALTDDLMQLDCGKLKTQLDAAQRRIAELEREHSNDVKLFHSTDKTRWVNAR